MIAQKTIQDRTHHLQSRRANKSRIIAEGGEQALSHSWDDVKRIDYALARIAEGQYGLCCNCGTPIAEERLDSIPETPWCTPCAKEISQ